VLDFFRIKHLIQDKISVVARGGQAAVSYAVHAYNLNVGYVPEHVINAIAEADVLVGVLTERNVNVVYELAVRNVVKDEMLLLVRGNPGELVPMYLQGWGQIRYDQFDSRAVSAVIEKLADELKELTHRSPMPAELVDVVDRSDGRLCQQLQNALQDIEGGGPNAPRRPGWILNLAKYLDPGLMLSAWTTYYPYSVVRIKWKRKAEKFRYAADDMEGSAVIYTCDDSFLNLYNVAGRLPDPDGPRALTAADLLGGLERDEIIENLDEFTRDNARVTDKIVLGDGFAWSRVPLRLNQNHPKPEFRKTAYLPTLTGKRIIGDPERPHTAYYLIIYTPTEH
jgi:hypothetical protein